MSILKKRFEGIADRCRDMLEDGALALFDDGVSHLASVWFDNAEHNELSINMADYILFSGIYGDRENRIAVVRSTGGGKLGYILSRAFPPYNVMCDIYPSLEGKPLLMPIYIIRRLFGIIFSPRLIKRSLGEIKTNENLSSEKREKTADTIKKLGLKY